MFSAIVVGRVVSTNKHDSLVGKKLMMVRRLDEHYQPTEEVYIAADAVGAGVDEWVLVTTGSSARRVWADECAAADATIVGIIDPNEQDQIR